MNEERKMPQLRVLKVSEACEKLEEYGFSITPQKMRLGLQQRIYPFGDAIKSTEWVYDIYEHLLDKWIAERI